MREDPILSELRQIREEMLAAHGGDMDGLFNLIKEIEEAEASKGRIVVSLPPRRLGDQESDAA